MYATANRVFIHVVHGLPANTQRNKHVIITSKRRFDVIITCLLRCVFAGLCVHKTFPNHRWFSSQGPEIVIKYVFVEFWVQAFKLKEMNQLLKAWQRKRVSKLGYHYMVHIMFGTKPLSEHKLAYLLTNFREILTKIQTFSYQEMHLKVSTAKWCLFCFGLSVFRVSTD